MSDEDEDEIPKGTAPTSQAQSALYVLIHSLLTRRGATAVRIMPGHR